MSQQELIAQDRLASQFLQRPAAVVSLRDHPHILDELGSDQRRGVRTRGPQPIFAAQERASAGSSGKRTFTPGPSGIDAPPGICRGGTSPSNSRPGPMRGARRPRQIRSGSAGRPPIVRSRSPRRCPRRAPAAPGPATATANRTRETQPRPPETVEAQVRAAWRWILKLDRSWDRGRPGNESERVPRGLRTR